MKRKKAAVRPATIDEYLAPLDDDRRAALEKLRRTVRAAAPGAEECISYGIPAFRWRGRVLVHFASAAKHLSFFPGAHPLVVCRDDVKGFSTSKGTVRFSTDHPLPATVVRKLVKARMAEHAERPPAASKRAGRFARGRRPASR